MQTLDVISVNLWHIAVSLANLLILLVILKKFLYKPVKKMMTDREKNIQGRLDSAAEAERLADEKKAAWEEKLAGAQTEANAIIKNAADRAKLTADRIVEEAQGRAEGIVRRAEAEAELEKRKAQGEVKREIVEVSGLIAEKMLEREVNPEDHRKLIDSFIDELGDGDDGTK